MIEAWAAQSRTGHKIFLLLWTLQKIADGSLGANAATIPRTKRTISDGGAEYSGPIQSRFPIFCRSRQLPHGFLELVFHLPKGRVAIDRTRRFNPLQNDLTVDL